MNTLLLANQQKLIFKSYLEDLQIGMDGERESQENLCCQYALIMMMISKNSNSLKTQVHEHSHWSSYIFYQAKSPDDNQKMQRSKY